MYWHQLLILSLPCLLGVGLFVLSVISSDDLGPL